MSRKRAPAPQPASDFTLPERFHLALDASELGTFFLHPASGSIDADPRQQELFGFIAGEFDGRLESALARVEAVDREALLAQLAELLRTGNRRAMEIRLVLPTGEERWLEIAALLHGQIGDDATKVFGVTQDITERKLRESVHRIAEHRYRAMLQALPDLIFLTDSAGVLLSYHAPDRSKLYLPPERFLRRSWREVLPPEVAGLLEDLSRRAIASGETQRGDYSLTIGGRPLAFEVRMAPCGFDCLLSVVRDVSDLARATDELQLASAISEHLSEAVWVVRRSDLTIVQANAACERLYGVPIAEIVGRRVTDFNAGDEATARRIAEEVYSGIRACGHWEGDLARRRADGQTFWSHTRVTGFDHPQWGEVTISFSVDVTERRALEAARERGVSELAEAKERAEAANLAKSTFLATMSHEIRTPMNGVLGMVQLLEGTALDEKQRTYVELLRSSSQSLLALLNQVLDLAKIEAGQVELKKQPFSPRRLAEEVVELLRPRAAERRIALTTRLEWPGELVAVGDELRVREILLNFTENALKFTERGEVEVRVSCLRHAGNGGGLRLAVRDSGPGISAAERELLFRPFQQLVSAGRRGGTGLGLAICRRLAELMGGEVGCDSAVGEGSTFWAELPVELAAERRQGPPRAAEALALDWQGRWVLLAEDDPASQLVAKAMLERLGIGVVVCADGREAMARWEDRHWDAALLDCLMPEVDGWETARFIRERERSQLQHTPIVALTAFALDSDRERCVAAGMDEVLTKPLDLARLAESMRRIWGGSAP